MQLNFSQPAGEDQLLEPALPSCQGRYQAWHLECTTRHVPDPAVLGPAGRISDEIYHDFNFKVILTIRRQSSLLATSWLCIWLFIMAWHIMAVHGYINHQTLIIRLLAILVGSQRYHPVKTIFETFLGYFLMRHERIHPNTTRTYSYHHDTNYRKTLQAHLQRVLPKRAIHIYYHGSISSTAQVQAMLVTQKP